MKRFVLYMRPGCHLCEHMLHEIEALRSHLGFTVELCDIDADRVLEETYGEAIPVLTEDGNEVCRYRFDEAAFRRRFR